MTTVFIILQIIILKHEILSPTYMSIIFSPSSVIEIRLLIILFVIIMNNSIVVDCGCENKI